MRPRGHHRQYRRAECDGDARAEAILEQDPAAGEAFLRVIPMGRPAALAEVASAVAYLASEEASFITGQVLGVNGGSTMN
jgi:2,3-dihydroxy-2,3-dihydro-p-cumate dehydrogenase